MRASHILLCSGGVTAKLSGFRHCVRLPQNDTCSTALLEVYSCTLQFEIGAVFCALFSGKFDRQVMHDFSPSLKSTLLWLAPEVLQQVRLAQISSPQFALSPPWGGLLLFLSYSIRYPADFLIYVPFVLNAFLEGSKEPNCGLIIECGDRSRPAVADTRSFGVLDVHVRSCC